MFTDHNIRFLRRAMLADAAISGVTGLIMLFGAGVLSTLLDVPAALLRYSGVILIPFALGVLYVSAPARLSRPSVRVVMAANIAWVVASVGLLMSGLIAPNALGAGFVIFQAIAVAAFAELQFTGLRRASVAA